MTEFAYCIGVCPKIDNISVLKLIQKHKILVDLSGDVWHNT